MSWANTGRSGISQADQDRTPFRYGQELVGVHQRRVRPVLTVNGDLYQQIDESIDIIENARKREIEKSVIVFGRGRPDHEVLLFLEAVSMS
jgi:hypothetical protein